jgi:predicted Co/Zn/Cd cation transporter (cation efflux family)
MKESMESPENSEQTGDDAPVWFIRLNQGCLVLIAFFGVILATGRILAGGSEAGLQGVVSVAVGVAVILVSAAVCRLALSEQTFNYLRKKWNSVLGFIQW